MKVVYKYSLVVSDYQELPLPKGAQILTVQSQYNVPQLWALIDTVETEREFHRLVTKGTGHPFADDASDLTYISTYQLMDGELVFHVFEKTNDNNSTT